ncbi:MAG: Gfo/Idh/MocA family oxidoreductase [Lautropia sp.]|nr:Gfo/Idh/MocA family oxidoreductase [Lautropia sp.]
MNLHKMLQMRAAERRPVKVAIIGAGKFGSMFITQVRTTVGMHLVGVADLMPARARERMSVCGWDEAQFSAKSIDEAIRTGGTLVTDDAMSLIRHEAIEVIIEATGDPTTGIRLCLAAIENNKHIVMVNVEADALAGPLLARRAAEKGVVYSLAWGDQPALVCEHVDWARASGFKVVAAGKGTRYHPSYHQSTPDTVWDILTKYMTITDRSLFNPKMFNSFVDGTKSGIEMTAICNATGLVPQTGGLGFPPASRFELAQICRPKADGGTLEKAGVTEVVSSVNRDGSEVPYNLVMGTYVVIEGDTEYARRCFREYSMLPDESGRYAALYRPIHMIGLELGISVASAALRNEPTGVPIAFNSDVIATAKRAMKSGEVLDGEGGFCVWGKQTPAEHSLEEGLLPLGLAHNVKLVRDLAEGQSVKWSDVKVDANDTAVKIRREMEAVFGKADRRMTA